jgi:hypothetical protein
VLGVVFGLVHCGAGQTLSIPPRPSDAPGGSVFAHRIEALPLAERETLIEREVLRGNVPDFLRRLHPVAVPAVIDGITNRAVIYVTPDYLAVGSEENCFLAPLTPQTAQRIADATGCLLPTRWMVDAIHSSAAIKLTPAPIPPSAAMTGVAAFVQHSAMVRRQRWDQWAAHPLGSLVVGHKKDVVLSSRLANAPGKVAIYGWHLPDGRPIQPLYVGHSDTWVDYSHAVRLVHSTAQIDGRPRPLDELLGDPELAVLLSSEGPLLNVRYPTNRSSASRSSLLTGSPAVPPGLTWFTNAPFAERTSMFQLLPDVRVQINEPTSLASASANRQVVLVLYALPNGNTIEQTAGRRVKPADDWHFDIQHIAAQTRFVRAADTNRLWVIAYLEAEPKSWPSWRKAHVGEPMLIPAIVETLVQVYSNRPVRVALSGHSGGGSFIFGYLNAVNEIPDAVERIAFLDANYGYDPAHGHTEKLEQWLRSSDRHFLNVLAYDDAIALLDGKPFVSATGGTWYRSHLMKTNFAEHFKWTSRLADELEIFSTLSNRVQFLLKENPGRKILHTVQVDRNGFIHSMLSGTTLEGRGYEYFGPRSYERWIESASAP